MRQINPWDGRACACPRSHARHKPRWARPGMPIARRVRDIPPDGGFSDSLVHSPGKPSLEPSRISGGGTAGCFPTSHRPAGLGLMDDQRLLGALAEHLQTTGSRLLLRDPVSAMYLRVKSCRKKIRGPRCEPV